MAKNISIPVITSGGITSDSDILEIKKLTNHNIAGSIVGRALYDKKVSYSQLI